MRFATALLCPIILLSLALLPGAAAQSLEEPAVDPQTGELLPFGFDAPPAEMSAATRGGEDLTPVQYLPSGSSKLVRFTGALDNSSGALFFQDGGSLLSAELNVASGDEFLQDTLVLDAQPSDAVVVGDLAFVALRKDRGLLIVDVSDPEDFVEVGQIEGRDLLSVAVSGDYAYAGQGTSGIVVYNISDPANPTETAAQPSAGSSNGTFVDGSTLYVAAGTSGLRVFDISDPTNPAAIGSLGTNDQFCTYVTVRDGVAWLTGAFGLIAADVSDPAAPVQIGSFGTDGETTYEIAFDGNTAYLPGLDGLRTLDVTDPASISELALVPGSQVLSVNADPAFGALYAERFSGLYTVTGEPDAPDTEQAYENAGFAHKMDFAGDLLYVTDLAGRLRIIDTSSDEAVEIGRVDVPPNTQFVNVVGNYAYVADADFGGTGLTIVDVSTPSSPVAVGGFFSGNQAFGLDVVAEDDDVTVYLANGFSGLVVLDASDPTTITELGGFPIGANVVDVSVRDDVAYVVSFGGGMLTLDVSDPANITQLDAAPEWGFLNAIDLGQRYAHVADGQNGLRVVDIDEPSDIVTLDTAPTLSQARDVAATYVIDFDLAFPVIYVADDFFGVRQYSVSLDNGEADEIGSFESGDRGIGIATNRTTNPDGSLAVLAAGEAGIYLFELPPNTPPIANEDGTAAEAFALQSAFPNPFRDATTLRFTLPEASTVTLAVYDVLGRRVATLADGPLAAGDHEATFDAAGLPSGVYLVRLAAGNRYATQRVSHVR